MIYSKYLQRDSFQYEITTREIKKLGINYFTPIISFNQSQKSEHSYILTL